MTTAPRFDQLLPHRTDPKKEAMRGTLITVLNSKAEILPSANSPRGKLWHLVNTPNSSLTDCAEVIQLDSALAARIFRVANSGAYGGGGQSDNIADAVVRLGLKFVREQVFNAGVFKQFSGWVLPPEWDAFWLRNIFVARLCERISAVYGPTNGSEYLAGLLHDMGWLFVASYFPNEFTQIFTSGLPVTEAEKELLPFGHAQISAAIAARSLLPERAVNAIVMHHFPMIIDAGKAAAPESNPYFLGVVLHLCDGMADACQMDMFGQTEETFEKLQESVTAQWLNQFRPAPDLKLVAEEELAKSQQIFEAYFSNRKFN
jgi:HD-like signal output (HDOD) protein